MPWRQLPCLAFAMRGDSDKVLAGALAAAEEKTLASLTQSLTQTQATCRQEGGDPRCAAVGGDASRRGREVGNGRSGLHLAGKRRGTKGLGPLSKRGFRKAVLAEVQASLELRASIEAQGLLKSAAPGRAGRRFS